MSLPTTIAAAPSVESVTFKARSHIETGLNSTAEFSSVSKYDQGVKTGNCTLSVNKISHLRPDSRR